MQQRESLLRADQKEAVLVLLKWVGLWASLDISDSGLLQPKTQERLAKNAALLQIDLSKNALDRFDDEENEDLLFGVLNSMADAVKPWLVVETYMMLSAGGNITSRAMNVTLLYCQRLGISETEYLEIIKAAYLITEA